MGMDHCHPAICHNVAWFEHNTEIENAWSNGPSVGQLMILPHGWIDAGQKPKGKIIARILTKDIQLPSGKIKKIKVYLANSSEYANVDETSFEWNVFGKRQKSIKRFLRDFGIQAKIKDTDIVQSWY